LGARGNYAKLPAFECSDNFPIYRLFNNFKNFNEMGIFPLRKMKNILSIANGLEPDLILCHLAENMPLALKLQNYLKVPIILHVEIASSLAKRKFVGNWQTRFLRVLLGEEIRGYSYWSWLCEKADVVITSEPKDRRLLNSLKNGKTLYYLPWPAQIPLDCKLPAEKSRYRAIYAGTLLPNKNTQVFEWIIPSILKNTPTKEFWIIGTGSHEHIIRKLKAQFGSAIVHIPSLPRCEILKLIASSFYAFTPVKEGGWGFLGDCWGAKTPLLMFNNIFVEKKLDLCVAESEKDLIQKINQLYQDKTFYEQMQNIGYELYDMRSSSSVGDKLFSILKSSL